MVHIIICIQGNPFLMRLSACRKNEDSLTVTVNAPGEGVLSRSLHCFIEKWRQREDKIFVTGEFSIENRATADVTEYGIIVKYGFCICVTRIPLSRRCQVINHYSYLKKFCLRVLFRPKLLFMSHELDFGRERFNRNHHMTSS